jgi:hypothetical protein
MGILKIKHNNQNIFTAPKSITFIVFGLFPKK